MTECKPFDFRLMKNRGHGSMSSCSESDECSMSSIASLSSFLLLMLLDDAGRACGPPISRSIRATAAAESVAVIANCLGSDGFCRDSIKRIRGIEEARIERQNSLEHKNVQIGGLLKLHEDACILDQKILNMSYKVFYDSRDFANMTDHA